MLNPDVLVTAALVILALTSILLVGAAMPMMAQAGRTLSAYERLAETLKAQVNPTLAEVMQLLGGLNSLKSVLTNNVAQVGQTVEGAAATASGIATKYSSVLAAGLQAGLKSYIQGHTNSDNTEGK